MIFGYFTLFVALLIEVVGAYYSITGLAAIFSGAVIPILIMGGVLEVGKVTAAVWLKNNWHRASMQFKLYLLPAVVLLMFITSMGIFGFLSKAHNDQNLVSGDVVAKIAIYDEKIKIQKDNIESARRALQQMDAAVDQTMSRSTNEQGADKAANLRRSQARERANLQNEIARAQTEIVKLNDLRAPIAAEVRKVEAEVGPIKYIAKLIYGDNPDANLLERAVVWVIIMIVAVFDPLALVLILAAQQSLRWARGEPEQPRTPFRLPAFVQKLQNRFKRKQDVIDITQMGIDDVIARANREAAEASLKDSVDISVIEPVVKPKRKTRAKKLTVVKPKKATKKKVKKPTPKVKAKPFRAKPKTKVKPNTKAVKAKVLPKPKRKPAPKKKVIEQVIEPILEEPIIEVLLPVEPEVVSPNAPGLDAADERPGDYLKLEEPTPQIPERPREAAPAPNRGVWTVPVAQADNSTQLGKASQTGFGNAFPTNPTKGDVYLRTDYLPNRLFKYNDKKWIEVDKNQTDVYAYDELYIKHLVQEIDAGRYDVESLTDTEREQIQKYLNNAQ